MEQARHPFVIQVSRKYSDYILALCWGFGLIYGITAYYRWMSALAPAVFHTMFQEVSFATLLCMKLLPVLFSCCASICSISAMIYLICFGKAVLIGFVYTGILYSFGPGSWILCAIFFTNCLSTPLLYFYWLRSFSSETPYYTKLFGVFSSFAVFSGLLLAEYSIILPFMACLIDF